MTHEERAELAKNQFDEITKNPPSKQALRRFIQKRADGFLSEQSGGRVARKVRRQIARNLSKRITLQTFEGWKANQVTNHFAEGAEG